MNRRKLPLKGVLALIILVMVLAFQSPVVSNDLRTAYDRYVAAYNEYRDAITSGQSQETVRALAEEYAAAKSAFESLQRPGSAEPAPSPAGQQHGAVWLGGGGRRRSHPDKPDWDGTAFGRRGRDISGRTPWPAIIISQWRIHDCQ